MAWLGSGVSDTPFIVLYKIVYTTISNRVEKLVHISMDLVKASSTAFSFKESSPLSLRHLYLQGCNSSLDSSTLSCSKPEIQVLFVAQYLSLRLLFIGFKLLVYRLAWSTISHVRFRWSSWLYPFVIPKKWSDFFADVLPMHRNSLHILLLNVWINPRVARNHFVLSAS